MKKSILISFFTFIILYTFGQQQIVAEQIIENAKHDNKVMQHMDVLSNRIGGRVIGSDAYESAEKWAAGLFESWGLEVELDKVGDLPVGFNRGPWFGRVLSDQGMQLHFATPSYTAGTKGVQQGHLLIEPKTAKEFERMKGKLKGAWVLITGTSSGRPIDYSEEADQRRASIIAENEEIKKQNREIRTNNKEYVDNPKKQLEEISLKDEPALFYKEMCEAGILGVIQSAPVPIVALSDRSNIYTMSFDQLPTVCDIKLDKHQYAKLEQMAKERRRFLLEFDIRNHFRPGPVAYHNVIGKLEGTEFPDEYVIVSGHLDAYDVAGGAVDCGTGVVTTLEIARMIAKTGAKPKRTILFILFAGEEFGLLGSTHWVKENPEKLPYIVNMFNRDGGPHNVKGISVTSAMMPDFETICAPLITLDSEYPFVLEERGSMNRPQKAWGTDSGPFAVEGVPTISFNGFYPDGDNFSYREIWHTERDSYNMIIPKYMEQSAWKSAVVVWGVANLDHQLSKEGYFKE